MTVTPLPELVDRMAVVQNEVRERHMEEEKLKLRFLEGTKWRKRKEAHVPRHGSSYHVSSYPSIIPPSIPYSESCWEPPIKSRFTDCGSREELTIPRFSTRGIDLGSEEQEELLGISNLHV
ncbi:hypothetical protein GBF38_010984 [Nibea albiflora]|uniref:Uncharacterized protein n=1 Tax=Nibea albiflora TaxID=240163 RepID=A0ACB7ETK5_NIBAL|nr:hypothetical protein GBF38_010984 [Nibea albiflora]